MGTRRWKRRPADEPVYEYSHQHKAPSQWPVVALAIVLLICVGLIALLFGQQVKMSAYQEEMRAYMQGKGEYRDAEARRLAKRAEDTRALLCAVMPQLRADDDGVLERTATDLGCPKGPAPIALDGKTPALPTPIDGAQSNSTGDPTGSSGLATGTGRGNDAGRVTASGAPSGGGGDVAGSSPVTPERTPTPAPGETEPPPDSPPESGGGSREPGVQLCLPLLGCASVF